MHATRKLRTLLGLAARRLLAAPLGGARPVIGSILPELGRAAGVPWVQVHLLAADGRTELACEWISDEASFSPPELRGFDFADYPVLIERALTLRPFTVLVDELPTRATPERERLERQKIRRLIALPCGADGVVRGGMLLHDDQPGPALSPGSMEMLHLAADLFLLALARDEAERSLDSSQHRLRESSHRMRALLETAFEGFVVSRAGFVLDANDGFARMCGYEPAEAIGMSPVDVTTPESAVIIGRNIANEVHTPYVVEGVRKDGSHFPMLIQGTECYFEGERVRITGFRDLTDEREREAERERLEERMRQGQKLESLGVLAGGIAHDFNNLLVGVLGNAELAAQDLPADSSARAAVEAIQLAATRAAELVSEMLVQAGQSHPHVRPVHLPGLILEMRELLWASLPKTVQLESRFAEDLPPVMADPTQLRQVAMNLITNAADACGAEGGSMQVEADCVTLDAPPRGLAPTLEMVPGRYVRVLVRDDGQGMDEATVARMFEPFFTTKFAGRGLGLAAVLGIVRGHGGGIAVHSEVGRGTTVELFLPVADDPASAEEAPGPGRPSPMKDERRCVLVVDDEQLVRDVAVRMLRAAGYDVLSASDGAEGLRMFAADPERIDAIVLDIAMPGLGGAEVYAELRSMKATVPVLFSSGYLEPDLPIDPGDAHRVGFLQKPYRMAELSGRLDELLRRGGGNGAGG